MNRPRRQHYVTRAYLEGFLPTGEKHLYVYSRGKLAPFRALPQNVAKIHNYYSQKQPDGTFDDRVEHMLQTNVEDPGLAVIRLLLSGHYALSPDDRGRLAVLLAIQEYRVPWMRQQMEEFTAGMLERFTRSMLDAPGVVEESLVKLALSDAAEADTMAETMRAAFRNGDVKVVASPAASLNAMGYALAALFDFYFAMDWEILETDSVPFVTSDCPVHRYYVPVHTEIPYSGLLDWRVQVRFPLSSRKVLVLRHDRNRIKMVRAMRKRGHKRLAFKILAQTPQIRNMRVSAADVRYINSHTMAMAARYVFSSTELPDAADRLQGECMNVRQVLTDYPGGFTEFRAHYPR
jgi:hypothetical protein